MSPAARHLACALCRDRKVKCDGGRPSCQRCVKVGKNCVYHATPSASRAELQETIRSLSERIGRWSTEPSSVPINCCRRANRNGPEQTEAYQLALMTQHHPSTISRASELPFTTGLNNLDPVGLFGQNLPMAGGSRSPYNSSHGLGSSADDGSPVSGESVFASESQNLCSFPGNPDAERLAFGTTSTSFEANTTPLVAQETSNLPSINHNPPSTGTHGVTRPRLSVKAKLPSLHEVQRWSSRSQLEASLADDCKSSSESGELLQEFVTLNTTAVRAQQDIIGIAETAAMYLQYFRQVGGNHDTQVLMRLIETLEQRLCEISSIASDHVIKQAQRSRDAVGAQSSYRSQMKTLDAELCQINQHLTEFFQNGYDLGRPLADQL
jgi:hypothetical protein